MLLTGGCEVWLYLSKWLKARESSELCSQGRICAAYSWLPTGDSCSQTGSHRSSRESRPPEGVFLGSVGGFLGWLLPGIEWQKIPWFQDLVTSLSSVL